MSDRVEIEHVATVSGDLIEEQSAKLQRLFPEVFVEGKIDFDKLRTTLGASAESGPGRFQFSWAGKDDAIALLQTPSQGTKKALERFARDSVGPNLIDFMPDGVEIPLLPEGAALYKQRS